MYLEEFATVLKTLVLSGMICQNAQFKIHIRSFICDAPARAFILGLKHHTSFYCCNKCVQKGQSFQKRLIFIKTDNTSRTDHDFRNRSHPEHHNIQSKLILEDLPIDMVEQFPFDFMHVFCLGLKIHY